MEVKAEKSRVKDVRQGKCQLNLAIANFLKPPKTVHVYDPLKCCQIVKTLYEIYALDCVSLN